MENRVTVSIKDHIADVKLNRPDKMNALDDAMFLALIETGQALAADASVRCVVLSGEGKAFCAGLDLSNFKMPDESSSVTNQKLADRTHGNANKFQKCVMVWHDMPVPVIAAVHGVSLGGGVQIMMGADIRYIAPDTKCSIMEMKWGIVPDLGGTQLWRHNVRGDILRELTYTNRMFSGEDAVKYGFATHTSSDPHADAMQLASIIAKKSPTAIVKAKQLLNEAPYLGIDEGLMNESIIQDQIMGNKNQLEAVFSEMQKRKAQFEDFR